MLLSSWLRKQPTLVLSLFLSFTAFATYFCVYALRKPFTAATFEGIMVWGIQYKILITVAHVLGYASSKLLGIKVISEITPAKRAAMIRLMAILGLASLLLFGVVPPPYNWVFMYFNGLPLGMMYGLVLGYLEGRRVTEMLGAILCVSFIFGSGIVKSVGRWLIQTVGISDYLMPFCAGAIFFLPLLLFNELLRQSPPPNEHDKALRTERVPMNAQERKAFFGLYAIGLVALIVVYVVTTILRDIRENFAVEIFKELGITNISIFTQTETLVGLSVTLLAGFLFVIKDNRKALWFNYFFVGSGLILVLFCTFLFERLLLSPMLWMTLLGLGIYMAYIPYNCTLYERLIAVSRQKSNISFLLYPADFCGYLGSVAIMLFKNFGSADVSWLRYYIGFAYALPVIGLLLLGVSFVYFRKKWA